MSKAKIFIFSLIAIGILIGAGTAFFALFEPIEEEIRTAYSTEAKLNPFLAAERMITRRGIKTKVVRELSEIDHLPFEPDTLLISYNYRLEQTARKDKLLNWIDQGGHLILELQSNIFGDEDNIETPLLDTFQVHPVRHSTIFEDLEQSEGITSFKIYDDGETLDVQFPPFHALEVQHDEPILLISNNTGTQVVEFYFGQGLVTILTNFHMWKNPIIGKHDHAALLAKLVDDEPGTVLFFPQIIAPNLLDLIWLHGEKVILSLILLLLLSLWALNNRFGPMISLKHQQRRSLLEHINAVGRFDWHHHRANNILNVSRQELHHLIEKRVPQWHQKTPQQQWAWIAEHTQHTAEEIASALSKESDNAANYIHYIKIIQSIRKSL